MPSNQTPYVLIQAGSEASQADITQQIYSVDVEDVDRGCDKVTILMADAGSANADAVREGMTIWVDLGWETEHALIFEGLVEKVKPTAVAGGHRLEVVAYDYSAQMRKPRTPELTPKHVGTLKDILEALAKRNTIPIPFGKVEIGSMPSFTDDRPLLQGTMTDFEFIQFLAEEYRARAFVEVNEKPTDAAEVKKRTRVSSFYFMSEDALLAQEPAGKLTYCRGFGALIEFEYKRVASGAAPSTTATVTDPDTGEPSTVSGDPPAIGPDNEADADRADRIGSVQSPGRGQAYSAAVQVANDVPIKLEDLRKRREAAGLPSDPKLAERLVRQDKTRVLGFSGRGLANGTVFLRAKSSIEIVGVASWAAGRWYAHRVNHRIQRAKAGGKTQLTYRTEFQATR